MPYDEASFKAGFALGRVLWKPPSRMKNVNTGLGWTADKEWVLYEAGTVATSDPGTRQPVTKTNDGWCITAYIYNFEMGWAGEDWAGVVLISTVQSYVEGNGPQSRTDTFSYLGLTWYVHWTAQNATWGGATYYDTDAQSIDLNGGYNPPNAPMESWIFETIMQAANVRLTGGAA